jgi:hypothetical protein
MLFSEISAMVGVAVNGLMAHPARQPCAVKSKQGCRADISLQWEWSKAVDEFWLTDPYGSPVANAGTRRGGRACGQKGVGDAYPARWLPTRA